VTRGRLTLLAVVLVAVAAAVAVRMARSEPPPSPEPAPTGPSTLGLLVVNTDFGPLVTVLGAEGSAPPAAVVVPSDVRITIPGQGDGTVAKAAELAGPQAAMSMSNLFGAWIPHYAAIRQGKLAKIIDRAGGLEIGGSSLTGAEVLASLAAVDRSRSAVWQETVQALLASGVTWESIDLPKADSPTTMARFLNAASGAQVQVLPTEEVADGVRRAAPEALQEVLASAFGFPFDREVHRAIVLNGSGVPGVGESVAGKLIPGGVRIVVSENASSFDHDTTLIVVSEEDRSIGEAVRDLLGVGDVQVSGPASGLADVTIVIGKDFQA
jgi:hypothetical protein